MDSILDLFMGDPVYDDQKNVIRRDFGVKNIVALMVVGFIGYSLMGEMKPISGKGGGMKGGEFDWDWIKPVARAVVAVGFYIGCIAILFWIVGQIQRSSWWHRQHA